MTRGWPALPLLLMVMALGISGLGLLLGVWPASSPPSSNGPPAIIREYQLEESSTYKLKDWAPEQQIEFHSALLSRSPFSPQRAAYVRAPPQTGNLGVDYEPRLIGISGRTPNLIAMIKWEPEQPPQIAATGSVTPVGIIISISDQQIMIAQGEEIRTISMFAE